jgi:hypothetical protein
MERTCCDHQLTLFGASDLKKMSGNIPYKNDRENVQGADADARERSGWKVLPRPVDLMAEVDLTIEVDWMVEVD